MIKLLINEIDLDDLINSYKEKNVSFVFKNKSKTNQKWNYKFFLNGQLCSLDAYIVKDGIKFVPIGKNVELCNELLDHLRAICIDSNIPSITKTVECTSEISKMVINNVVESNAAKISRESGNHIKLIGYSGDIVNLNIYEDKLVIQTKPLCVFGVLLLELSKYVNIDFSETDLIDSTIDLHSELLNHKIQERIGTSYLYLDEALKDSLKSSYEFLRIYEAGHIKFSDYSGLLLGAFKALEGFLRKLLITKYDYRFDKKKSFDMFKKDNGLSDIDRNEKISENEKTLLNDLYRIYNQKRNVYLHGSATSTVIIKKYIDAKNIFDEILDALKNSCCIING